MMTRKQRLPLTVLLAVVLFLLGAGTSSVLAAPGNQEGDGETGEEGSHFCTSPDAQHPMAAKLATTYEVSYEQIKKWMCEDGHGLGQIAMALQTGKVTGDSVESLLAERAGGKGWGQIWKEKGVVRSDKDAGPKSRGHGRPAWAGPKQERTADHPGNGNGNKDKGKDKDKGGRPCWAGNPDPLPEGCVKPTDEAEVDD